MQKLWLIPDAEGKGSFDVHKLRLAIRGLPALTNWQESSEEILFECDLNTSDASIQPIPIQVNKNSISIGIYHNDGLKAALDIQKRYGEEMFAFSEESSPEVIAISLLRTPEELAIKLKLR